MRQYTEQEFKIMDRIDRLCKQYTKRNPTAAERGTDKKSQDILKKINDLKKLLC